MKHLYKKNLIALSAVLVIGKGIAQESYLDNSFGNGGIVTTTLFEPKAIALQQDGKILLAGGKPNPDTSYDFVVYRFNANGTADTNFGTGGKAEIIYPNSNILIGIAELPNGQLIGLGTNTTSGDINTDTGDFLFVRLNSDGTQDASFSNGGLFTATFDTMAEIKTPSKMILLPNGKILTAGLRWDTTLHPDAMIPNGLPIQTIAVFNSDMTMDTSFNTVGYKTISFMPAPVLAIHNNGNFLTGTHLADLKINRLLTNGQANSGFGNNGLATLDLGGQNYTEVMTDLAVLENGKILVSGSAKYEGNGSSAVLGCLKANGTVDTGFGTNGLLILENDSPQNEMIIKSIPLNNGKVVSGIQRWNANTGSYDYGLLVTTATGGIDSSFGNEGQIVTALDNNQTLTCIARQPDGKILAAGFDENSMTLIRYDISEALSVHPFNDTDPGISIYPNPASDKIIIKGIAGNTLVSIYTISGQKLAAFTTDSETPIDISSFPDGMYFLSTPEGSFKIVKNKSL